MFFCDEYYEYEKIEDFKPSISYFLRKEPLGRKYLRFLRRAKYANNIFLRKFYERRRASLGYKHNIEVFEKTRIGKGFYLGHPGSITINPAATLGEFVCIHKGATIGVENRGRKKGVPTIGNCVWIGINAMVFGGISIGNDVLISPGSVVNCDVPDHSVVYGNPAVIKSKKHATEGYISSEAYFTFFND